MGRVKSGASGSSSRESRSSHSAGGDYTSSSGSTSSDVKVKGLLNELHHLIHQVQVWHLSFCFDFVRCPVLEKMMKASYLRCFITTHDWLEGTLYLKWLNNSMSFLSIVAMVSTVCTHVIHWFMQTRKTFHWSMWHWCYLLCCCCYK